MSKFSPAEKAAIVLIALGEEVATEVIKHLSEREAKRIAKTMTSMPRIDKDTVSAVLADFAEELKKPVAHSGPSASEFTRTIVEKAFGAEKSMDILSGLGIEFAAIQDLLSEIEDAILIKFLNEESPNVIATTLCLSPAERRASLLVRLDPTVRTIALVEIASLSQVSKEAVEALESRLRELADKSQLLKKMSIGGAEVAASILNHLDQETANHLLLAIRETNQELAEKIESLMFRFDDLVRVGEQDMQKLLSNLDKDQLALALKKASDQISQYMFSNLSTRVQEDLKERIQELGKTRLADIEDAQRQIVALAKEMHKKKEIEIRSPSDVYV